MHGIDWQDGEPLVELCFFCVPQLYLWGSPFWVRCLTVSESNRRGSHIPSLWMVHAGCVFVAGIHPSRTWMSGSFESVQWNACVHRLDLGLELYSCPRVLGEWSQNPCYLQGKKKLYQKRLFSEEDGTHNIASSRTASPTHDQPAILAPLMLVSFLPSPSPPSLPLQITWCRCNFWWAVQLYVVTC